VSLGGLIYSNVLHGPFVFDDIFYIARNPAIKHLDRLDTIYLSNVSSLRFIPFLSFALNYHVHQLNVFGYHLVNIIIHIINALLVWWLATLTLQSPKLDRKRWEGREGLIAYSAALLFLVHPIETQAVSYITQRFASMVTLFYLLSICSLAYYRLTSHKQFLVYSLLSTVAAMYCKQIAITLPITLLLYLQLFFPVKKKQMIFLTLLFLSTTLIILNYYKFGFSNILSITQPSKSHVGDYLKIQVYFLTQFRVLCTYLKVIIFPFTQNFLYDFPISKSLFEPKTLASIMAILSMLVGSILLLKKRRIIGFGILWFFITISVESSVITIGHVIFEHRAYLPSVGLFLSLSVVIAEAIKNRKILVSVLTVLILGLSLLTYNRNLVYADRIVFWSDVLKKSPNMLRPYLNLGAAYYDEGHYGEAIRLYNKALSIDASYEEAYSNRGLVYMKTGRFDDAIKDYNKAIELNGSYVNALHNRGVLFTKLNKWEEALADLNKVLKINPSHAESYNERGSIYLMQGKVQEALHDFKKAHLFDPISIRALNNKGATYNNMGEYELAIYAFKDSLKIDSNFAPAYYNMSYSYFRMNDIKNARINVRKAHELGYTVDRKYYNMLLQGD